MTDWWLITATLLSIPLVLTLAALMITWLFLADADSEVRAPAWLARLAPGSDADVRRPEFLHVPTALGKTAVLLALAWLLCAFGRMVAWTLGSAS
jgi:hypothetical protein